MPSSHAADLESALTQLADRLESLTPEQWESPSLDEGWRVRDVAGHLLWRVGSPVPDMVADSVRTLAVDHARPAEVLDRLARKAAEADYPQIVAHLRAIAAEKGEGMGRTGVTELAEVVVHAGDALQPLGLSIDVPPESTKAIAEARILIAGPTLKHVLRSRTLVATDAGWSVGRGPAIEGTAIGILLYLYGRTALPSAGAEDEAGSEG